MKNLDSSNFIIRSENQGFLPIDNLRDFLNLINFKSATHYHEVIVGNKPRKLVFDIDLSISNTSPVNTDPIFESIKAYIPNIEKNKNNINYYIELLEINIIDQLINSLELTFQKLNITKDSIIESFDDCKHPFVCSSHGFEGDKFKFSLHVVFPIILGNYIEQKNLALQIIQNLPSGLQKIVDKGIYKKTMNLRLIGSTKSNSNRIKKPINKDNPLLNKSFTDNYTIHNHIVSDVDFSPGVMLIWPTSLLYKIRKKLLHGGELEYNNLIKTVNKEFIDKMNVGLFNSQISLKDLSEDEQKLIVDNTNGMIITSYRGGIRLQRNAAGYCKICKKIHDVDNGYVVKNDKGLFIGCYRSKQYNDTNKHICVKEYCSDTNSYKVISSDSEKKTEPNDNKERIIYINKRYIDSSIYNNINNTDLLLIKSGTGSGKSYSLINYLKNREDNDKLRVLMISYRRSLADELHNKYKDLGFTHYSKDAFKLKGDLSSNDKLIIQVESLHKLLKGGYKPYDLVILDEANKTVEQFNSGLTNNPHGNKSILFSIMKTEKIIAMDAFLHNDTIKCISQFRNKIKEKHADLKSIDYIKVINEYKHKSDRKYYNISNKLNFKSKIIKKAEKEKIFIACNSKAFAEEIYTTLNTIYNSDNINNKKIKLYHGQSEKSIKDELSDVNTNWKVDVLIYTSVVEAGNSFDIEWFDSGFLYFTNRSTNHLGCLQMTDRIRKIKNNECYFHISDISYSAYSMDDIENKLNMANFISQNKISDTWLAYSTYKRNGEIKYDYEKDAAYYTFIRNVAMDEYSKANFRELLYNCWMSTGIQIIEHSAISDSFNVNVNPGQKQEIIIRKVETKVVVRDTKKSIKDQKIQDIVNASVGNSDIDTSKSDKELDEATRTKLLLMKTYNVKETDITEEFIKKYNKPVCINGYQTRKKILKCGGIEEYKKYMLDNYKSLNSEYTPMDKKYKDSNYVDKMIVLDVLNILSNNKSLNIIQKPTEKITIEKSILQNRINTVINKFKTLDSTYKFKNRLLNAKPDYRIRVINNILASAIDIKLVRERTHKSHNEKYNLTIIGYKM